MGWLQNLLWEVTVAVMGTLALVSVAALRRDPHYWASLAILVMLTWLLRHRTRVAKRVAPYAVACLICLSLIAGHLLTVSYHHSARLTKQDSVSVSAVPAANFGDGAPTAILKVHFPRDSFYSVTATPALCVSAVVAQRYDKCRRQTPKAGWYDEAALTAALLTWEMHVRNLSPADEESLFRHIIYRMRNRSKPASFAHALCSKVSPRDLFVHYVARDDVVLMSCRENDAALTGPFALRVSELGDPRPLWIRGDRRVAL